MKKIPRSVSKVIKNEYEMITTEVDGVLRTIGSHEVERAFGKIPAFYRVTYTLAPKHGRFLVCKSRKWVGPIYLVSEPGILSANLAVCFLPKSWSGKRVNRKAVKL